jgi:hypothetical protein
MSARPRRHQVFVSYSTKDQAIADAVREHLQNNGVSCWMAPHNLLGGSDWATGIVEAIDQSQALLLILSQASNVSDDVKREVGRASTKRIPIVPFFIENVELSKHMEYFLATTHWLGADARHIELRMAHLLDTVKTLVGDPIASGAQRIPVPPPARQPEPAVTPQPQPAEKTAGDLARLETSILTKLRPILRFPAEDSTAGPGAKPTTAGIAALIVGGLGLLFSLQGLVSALFPGATPEAFVFTMFPMLRLTTIAAGIASVAGNLGLLVGGHRMYLGTVDGPGITMAAVRWQTLVLVAWFVLTMAFLVTGPVPVRSAIMNATLTTAFLAAIQIGIVWKLTAPFKR